MVIFGIVTFGIGGSFTSGSFLWVGNFFSAGAAGVEPNGLVRCTGTLVAAVGGGLGGVAGLALLAGALGNAGLAWISGAALSDAGGSGVGGGGLATLPALLGFSTGVGSTPATSSIGVSAFGVVLRVRGFGAGFAEAADFLGEPDSADDSSGVSPSFFVRLGLRGLAGGSIVIVPPVP
jgi:hypothetical protein